MSEDTSGSHFVVFWIYQQSERSAFALFFLAFQVKWSLPSQILGRVRDISDFSIFFDYFLLLLPVFK